MDLIVEASSGGRVLAARHITADQAVPEMNNAVNTSLLCYSMPFEPDFNSYLTALHVYAPVLWTCGALAVLSTFVLFVLTLKSIYRRRPATLGNAVFVLAVYPVVATVALIATVVPRSRVVCEAVAQQAVMVGMYHLFCLLIEECGGVEQLIRCAEGARLETRVLPCCCWPCCIIPRPELHRSKILSLRLLVLQLPIVQGLLYVLFLVLRSESMEVYLDSFIYIQPFIATSILFGVWGMIMCVRAAESAGFNPRGKFLALQLALLVVKLQGGLVKTLPEMVRMPCLMVIHPSAFINLIHNCVMITEMFLLSLWAYRLYTVPAAKFADKVRHAVVAVLEDTPAANKRYCAEGIGNKSFRSDKIESVRS